MAIRPFGGIQTMGAASQPVFGTTLTADSTLHPDQFSGNVLPGSNPSLSYLTLASVTGFLLKDYIIVGAKGDFIVPSAANKLDVGQITAIDSVNKILTVQGLLRTHASGEYVLLNEAAAEVVIVGVAATHVWYLGNSSTVAANDPSVFDVIAALASGQPTYWHHSYPTGQSNSFNTSEFWILMTQNDTFCARFSTTG